MRPLEPLTDAVTPVTVLYDGDCPFCRWTANRLRRWDRAGTMRIRPYQETHAQPVLVDLVAGLPLGRAVHVVDSAGRYAAGGDAVIAVVALLPGGRAVAALLEAVPVWRWVVRIAYRAVDRSRPLLSAAGFDGDLIRERNPLFDLPAD